ncbi:MULTISPECIES: DUF4019 domain-containing protein [unclassified Pseudoalteromonas]|uniref:DUF4019 domain-containing protein n=1 Tax=unclassified Pseudoalteromonas TaxID=194690 RepID=UPI00301429DD
MKKLLASLLCCVALTVSAANNSGEQVAEQWLSVVDAGHYGQSWQQSGTLFQSQVSKSQWQQALNSVRMPLGEAIKRQQTSVEKHSQLPGVPDGDYLIIQYQTEFKNKQDATEMLTLAKQPDGWHPVGYFIK